jgi:hypothetical protein
MAIKELITLEGAGTEFWVPFPPSTNRLWRNAGSIIGGRDTALREAILYLG